VSGGPLGEAARLMYPWLPHRHCLFLDVLIFFVPMKFGLLLKTKDSSPSESTQVKTPLFIFVTTSLSDKQRTVLVILVILFWSLPAGELFLSSSDLTLMQAKESRKNTMLPIQ
jgi:hypothetical protein